MTKTGLNEGIKIFMGPIFFDETRALNKDLSREDAILSLSQTFQMYLITLSFLEKPIDQISCINKSYKKIFYLSRVLIIYPNNKYGKLIRKGFSELRNINMQQKIKIEYFECPIV